MAAVCWDLKQHGGKAGAGCKRRPSSRGRRASAARLHARLSAAFQPLIRLSWGSQTRCAAAIAASAPAGAPRRRRPGDVSEWGSVPPCLAATLCKASRVLVVTMIRC